MQRSRFSDCRVCGERKTNEEMMVHELDCLQVSQEELNTQTSPDGNNKPANVNQVRRSRNQQPRLEDANDYNNDGNRVFRYCRGCGVQKSHEAMLRHELDCLQESQDDFNKQSIPDANNNHTNTSQVRLPKNPHPPQENANRDQQLKNNETIGEDHNNPGNLEPRPSRHEPTRLPDKISGPADEDQMSNPTSTSSSDIRTPEISEIDENEDQESESSLSDQSSSSAIPIQQISWEDGYEDEDDESETQSIRNNPSSPKRQKKKNKKSASLVTDTFRYDRKKPKNLFPPTKKYHYYPVTCDFCQKRFQPNELKAHQKKHHFKEPENVKLRKRAQSTAMRKGFVPEESPAAGSKSTGGMTSRFKFCYICGQMYGSRSIKIHEPQCLKKWRDRNSKLPPEQRAPEPVKPKPHESSGEIVAGKQEYKVPEYDPAVEAAFESHLQSLIACEHCSRRFSPDRIQYHTSCCIERPKSRTRDCATPKDGEIPR